MFFPLLAFGLLFISAASGFTDNLGEDQYKTIQYQLLEVRTPIMAFFKFLQMALAFGQGFFLSAWTWHVVEEEEENKICKGILKRSFNKTNI